MKQKSNKTNTQKMKTTEKEPKHLNEEKHGKRKTRKNKEKERNKQS